MVAARGVPGNGSLLDLAAGWRHGNRAGGQRYGGRGLEIAVLSPDYAAQPAAKEAIDLFEAAAEANGHTVTSSTRTATTPR